MCKFVFSVLSASCFLTVSLLITNLGFGSAGNYSIHLVFGVLPQCGAGSVVEEISFLFISSLSAYQIFLIRFVSFEQM